MSSDTVEFLEINSTFVKRFRYLLDKSQGQERVSWKTLASLVFHRNNLAFDLLHDDGFREYFVRNVMALRDCKTSVALTGWKTFVTYYEEETAALHTAVLATQKAHGVDLEEACFRTIRGNRERFEHAWKRFHGTKCT